MELECVCVVLYPPLYYYPFIFALTENYIPMKSAVTIAKSYPVFITCFNSWIDLNTWTPVTPWITFNVIVR